METRSRIYTDDSGKQWLIDENGNYLRDERGEKIPPMYARRIDKKDEFCRYDDSQGHCAFCGKLTCNGSCFK